MYTSRTPSTLVFNAKPSTVPTSADCVYQESPRACSSQSIHKILNTEHRSLHFPSFDCGTPPRATSNSLVSPTSHNVFNRVHLPGNTVTISSLPMAQSQTPSPTLNTASLFDTPNASWTYSPGPPLMGLTEHDGFTTITPGSDNTIVSRETL